MFTPPRDVTGHPSSHPAIELEARVRIAWVLAKSLFLRSSVAVALMTTNWRLVCLVGLLWFQSATSSIRLSSGGHGSVISKDKARYIVSFN